MNVEEEKGQKKDNFIQNLNYFLEEYSDAIKDERSFNRHSRNSANLSRVIGESFCRFIILDSNKPEAEKRGCITQTLSPLIDTITKSNNPYIEDERDRIILQDRLKRILSVGNNDSHDTNYPTNKRDLDEVKNNVLFLSGYILGEQLTVQIEENFSNKSKKQMDLGASIVINSDKFQGNVNKGDNATFGNQTFS